VSRIGGAVDVRIACGRTVEAMPVSHRAHVEALLAEAAQAHATVVAQLPPALALSVPVDAQGVTEAIDHLAVAAGLDAEARRQLIRPHAVNPAVMHARVFGRAPLSRDTVLGAFVEGARVRADALTALADAVGGEGLGTEIRALLTGSPLPIDTEAPEVVDELRAAYAAHERAAVLIADRLDTR